MPYIDGRFYRFARNTRGIYRKFLYILLFKHEPLIKVGHAIDMAQRASDLSKELSFKQPGTFHGNWDVFDFSVSHVFSADRNDLIVSLESRIKKVFKEHRHKPDEERLAVWCGDNHLHTEIFNCSILPEVLKMIHESGCEPVNNTPQLWEWSLNERRVLGDGITIPYKAQHPLRWMSDDKSDEELDEIQKRIEQLNRQKL